MSSALTSVNAPDSSGWSATQYNTHAAFVYSPKFTAPILDMLAAQPGEKIIDFGCGSGELALTIAQAVLQKEGGLVAAFDYSESMVEQARANGLPDAFVADAQALTLPPALAATRFDAVFSNATLHWCKRDPAGVLASARRVLRPGGRLVVEMGGFTNCIGVRAAVHAALRARGLDPAPRDPWFFPSVAAYTALLRAASFRPIEVSLTPRHTPLPPGGLRAWLDTFVRHSTFLEGMGDAERDAVIEEVVRAQEVDNRDVAVGEAEEGGWAMMYVRLRVHAIME
ncbi:hypothetical protein HWV62_31047 [Athelia sp. TMB]|nr:hypothetical protein HWV62_31047 [Athelia sp. TMB]